MAIRVEILGDLLEIGRPLAYNTKAVRYDLEDDFQHQKAQKQFRASGDNRSHHSPSSSSDIPPLTGTASVLINV